MTRIQSRKGLLAKLPVLPVIFYNLIKKEKITLLMQNINANLAEKCSWCTTYKDDFSGCFYNTKPLCTGLMYWTMRWQLKIPRVGLIDFYCFNLNFSVTFKWTGNNATRSKTAQRIYLIFLCTESTCIMRTRPFYFQTACPTQCKDLSPNL